MYSQTFKQCVEVRDFNDSLPSGNNVQYEWIEQWEVWKMKLYASGENYLEAILILQKEKGMVRSRDVVDHMGYSRASISHAMTNLRNNGLVTMDKDMFLHLTAAGREIAERMYERHCFFKERLVALGVAPRVAEDEACQLEHIVSQDTFERLKEAYEKSCQKSDV